MIAHIEIDHGCGGPVGLAEVLRDMADEIQDYPINEAFDVREFFRNNKKIGTLFFTATERDLPSQQTGDDS